MTYDPKAHGAACHLCPLAKEGGNIVVPPTSAEGGTDATRLVIVGEGPGRVEEREGRPFAGPSGLLLNKLLGGFSRRQAHVTNAALCRADLDKDALEAARCCAPRLYAELAGLPATAPILALGKPAAKSVLNVKSILLARGFVWTAATLDEKVVKAAVKRAAKDGATDEQRLRALSLSGRAALAGRKCVPSVHPAFVLRADTWQNILRVDVDRAVRLVEGGAAGLRLYDTGPYDVVTDGTNFPQTGNVVAVDVETDGILPLETGMLCIGVSDGETTFVVHPTYNWPEEQRRGANHRDVWATLGSKLTAYFAGKHVVMHNGYNFDQLVLRQHGITFTDEQLEDTLLAHHTFSSHLPQKLDQVVSEYVDSAPWKVKFGRRGAEEKGLAPHKMPPEELVRYNSADARLTALAWVGMQGDLDKERAVYAHDKKLAAVCRDMQIAGIRMDTERRDELGHAMAVRAAALKVEMRELTGKKSFNPSQVDHVRKALFNRFRARAAYRSKKTGAKGTGVRTLELLRKNETRAGKLSGLILNWRGVSKIKATYLDAIHLGPDGRFHANWKPFGTVSGRLSCRLQSVPRQQADKVTGEVYLESRVRECYVPAEGNGFVYFDVGQAECRFAAYLSGDQTYIDEVNSRDPYMALAQTLFPSAADALVPGPDGKPTTKVGKELRQIAKMSILATQYLVEPETLFAKMLDEGVNVSFRQVVAAQSAIRNTHRGYFNYVNRNVGFVQKNGYFRTPITERIRWFGFYPKPTEIANYPVQGGIADLMNLRTVELVGQLPPGACVVLQVHDAIVVECRLEDVSTVKALVAASWARAITLSNGRSLVLPIELKDGLRWSELG